MRILYLTFDDLSRPFAWSVHVRAIVNGLVRRGHQLRLVAPGGQAPAIDAPCDPLPPGRFQHLAASASVFLRSARAFQPDALYVRGIHMTVTPALAAERAARPFVVEVNGLLEEEVRSRLRRMAVRAAHRFTLARAARVVTVSPLLRDALSARYGYPAERIDVVPNGADPDRFRPADRDAARRALGLPADRPIVACVASFYAHHAVDFLRSACARAGALLVLVGGEARSEPDVVGVGPVPHEAVPAYVAAADVCAYVLCAPHASFGFSPIKVFEYMAGGRPVAAATDLGELRTFINGSGAGEAVELDVEAYASLLRRLLEDRAARERLGGRGRELVESTYSWDRAAERVEGALSRALQA
jgi:glycosyltransferase involved in cell wall biosynthesis